MRLTKEELIDMYRPQSDRASGRTDCPTEEELVLATTDEMRRQERRRVAAHLMACRDCAEEYSLISPLKSFAQQAAKAEMAGHPGVISMLKAESPRVTRLPWWRRSTMYLYSAPAPFALAALLLLVSAALSVWVISIRREDRLAIARLEREVAERDHTVATAAESLEETRRRLDEARQRYEEDRAPAKRDTEIADLRRAVHELSRPQVNAPIVQLEPQASVRGQPSKETVIDVPSSASLFTLVLNVAGKQSHSNYALEILDQSGKIVWRGHGLLRSAYNTFTVVLPRRTLPAGKYHIKLYGPGDGKELDENYAVRIQYK